MLTWTLRLANNVQFMEIDCTGRLPPNLPSDFDPHTEQVSTAQGWEESSGVAAAAAKSLQSYPTLCDPTDGSPPGSTVPGILQARTPEWVAIPFSNAWKWKVKVKSLSRVWLFETPQTAAHQAPPSKGFSRQEYWSGVPLPSPSWGEFYSIPEREKQPVYGVVV